MSHSALDFLPLWALFLVTVAFIVLFMECGFRFGQSRFAKQVVEKDSSAGAMVGATLGLVAFLLAFTFGLAASRFEGKRQVVLEEANAIGTCYLRAGLLPSAHVSEVRELLKEYVDVRINAATSGNIEEALVESEKMHGSLWQHAEVVGKANPQSVMHGLFIQSLNEVIDLHSKRVLIGIRSRIPLPIWLGLGLTTLLAMCGMGYQEALAGKRSPAVLILVLAFAGILLLIADLDRAQEGLLRVGQGAMIDLRSSLARTP